MPVIEKPSIEKTQHKFYSPLGMTKMPFKSTNFSSNNFNISLHPSQDKLSKYIIGKDIGKGAYATVKAVIDKDTKQKLAMKVYDKFKLFIFRNV